jgi:methyl-accepting chemotaxis protein
MLIANPIYDVVFKYMMGDLKVAKTFVSAIIGEEVEELDFCPQELATKYKDDSLTVIRMDFLARIKIADGYKAVVIELQKALLSSDIKRFRRYLGGQYQSKDNIYTDEKKNEHIRPIYCIFFLGHALGNIKAPVLTVTNQVKDRATGEELQLRHDFIDCLHHKSWIVQISKLKEHRRDDLEKLLSIFDQNNITDISTTLNNHTNHILNVNEDDFPEAFKHIIRRLKQAAESKEVAEQMAAEDELISDFQNLERQIAALGETIEEKTKTIEEKTKTIEENTKALEENAKALEEKDKIIEELRRKMGL